MEPTEFAKPRTSASAVVSLVFGLLGCFPFVPGLLAFILGIVGIKKTSDPMVTGRGMAITGLILGLLSLGVWTLATGGGVYAWYAVVTPARSTAGEFTRALSESKIDEAVALSVEGTDRAALTALSEQMKPWGPFQSLEWGSIDGKQDEKMAAILIFGGQANFANATKTYSITLKQVGTAFKVQKSEYK